MDSLRRGFSSYLEYEERIKEKGKPSLEDYFVLKQAILSTHHGVEILLKYILKQKDESLLIVNRNDSYYKKAYQEKEEKGYQSIFQTSEAQKLHTITYRKVIDRVKSDCNVDIPSTLEEKLIKLNEIRNALTHAEVMIEDTDIEEIYNNLLLDLDVLFCKAIGGNKYKVFYGYSEIKANYDKYMKFLTDHQLAIKKKTVNVLCSALEKIERYPGANTIIYIEKSEEAENFLSIVQKEVRFGMDLYNGWCTGDFQITIKQDGHAYFQAKDNNEIYVIKFKSMIVYIPDILSNKSPSIIIEADDDLVEPKYQSFVTDGCFDEIYISDQLEKKVYTSQKLSCYEVVRFVDQRIFGCLNVKGLFHWNFHQLFRLSRNMTGRQVKEKLEKNLI